MEKRQLDLSAYRLDKSRDDLETARINLENNKFSQSINRSYYSIFHAIRALLALDKFDSKKHTGVISFFNKNYIKTGEIEPEFSRMVSDAFDMRKDSDYNDFFIAAREDAQTQLQNAEKLLKRIKKYIDSVIDKEREEDGKE